MSSKPSGGGLRLRAERTGGISARAVGHWQGLASTYYSTMSDGMPEKEVLQVAEVAHVVLWCPGLGTVE